MMLGKELDGVTVVSLEQAVAAPYCGLLLADAGARVIKIERSGGDFARAYDTVAGGHSAYFVWLNRGKESIVVDIDNEADRLLLLRVLKSADVFLHNLAPGALDRRGFSGQALRQTNPGLVTCEISGYGRDGPYAAMKAYDLLVQAEAGVCSVTGSAEAPARVGISMCDLATGLTAFGAVLRALLLRARTGEGTDLQIAMFDVLADWMNVPLLYQSHTGRAPARLGMAHPTLAPYGLFAAGDGKELLIAIQSNREWKVFCIRVLRQPALGDDPRFRTNQDRVANRSALDACIHAVFANHTAAVLAAILRESQIAFSHLNSVADLHAHPQLRRQAAEIGGQQMLLADLPVQTGAARPTRIPLLDEDGDRIRQEFAVS